MQQHPRSDRHHESRNGIDALTGMLSERMLDDNLAKVLAVAHTHATSLCVLLCNIADFDAFNEAWGRASGDQVLRLVAKCITSSIRQQDIAARLGEHEFVIILPATTLADAMTLAERIERAVKSRKLVRRHSGESLGTVTLSVDACECAPGDTSITLLARAQHALSALSPGSTAMPICDRPEPAEPQFAARI